MRRGASLQVSPRVFARFEQGPPLSGIPRGLLG